MNSIVVIGTNPPCPRCQLVSNIISAKVKEMGIEAECSHISYTSDEAKKYSEKYGLIPGTAKDVAKKINQEIDFGTFARLIKDFKQDSDSEYFKYNDCCWSIEMDNLLTSFQEKAVQTGVMMTPVLIINGEVKHQGSVPEIKKIDEWLLELLK